MDPIYSPDNTGIGGANVTVKTNHTIEDSPPFMTSPCPGIEADYDVTKAIIFAVLSVFGLLYCFLGYRLFKATMFLTGFLFSSVLTYLICLEEELLPPEGRIGLAVTVGGLCGLITMLIQYVGLFLTGYCFGAILGISAVLVMDIFYTPQTVWLPLGVIFLTGLFFALAILYFQKGLTVFGTALIGATLISMTLDYFVQLMTLMEHVFDVISLRESDLICWYNWLILCLVPALFLLGAIIQWRVTGRYIDHKEAVQLKRGTPKRADLQKLRAQEATRGHDVIVASSSSQRRDGTSTYTTLHPSHSRYRHLYQVRRSNGDVISQNYLRGIQNKLSTAVRKKVIATPIQEVSAPDPDLDQSQIALTQTQISDIA